MNVVVDAKVMICEELFIILQRKQKQPMKSPYSYLLQETRLAGEAAEILYPVTGLGPVDDASKIYDLCRQEMHKLICAYMDYIRFKDDEGRVDAPIGRSSKDRKKMAVTDKNSRDAVTDWSVIERFSQHTYVRCALHTGRTHQIRVHMAYINHPVLGDTVYGNPKSELGLDSQCLHARFLNLEHPRTGEQLSFESPLPDYFEEVLRKLRAKG